MRRVQPDGRAEDYMVYAGPRDQMYYRFIYHGQARPADEDRVGSTEWWLGLWEGRAYRHA